MHRTTCKLTALTKLIFILGALFFFVANPSLAEIHIAPTVKACPVTTQGNTFPNFDSEECDNVNFHQLNPTNRELWFRAILTVPDDVYQQAEPLGVYVSGKASSIVYINGEKIGQNGSPGPNKASEIVGKMDAVVYLPTELIKRGDNELVLRISGHHGVFELASPMHYLLVARYGSPTQHILEHYWRSLLPLGVLVLGVIYFGVLAARQTPITPHLFLPLMTLFTATQLCVEVSRGLVAYAYPFHDLRLALILLCSLGFGLSLFGHILTTLSIKHPWRWFAVGAATTVAMITATRGFDYKSAFAVGIPCCFALGLSLYKGIHKNVDAIIIAAGISVFLLVVIAAPGDFLDIYFFYLMAALIFYLFTQHSHSLAKEREARTVEKIRADKLQLIIDQHRLSTDSPTLSVKSAGKTELITIRDIVYCKGAGDYVELALQDGSRILHGDSLSVLEQTLPTTFIRVHRSYIVNTAEIIAVERSSSGNGQITLTNGESIPVSRRTMPSVRERLTQH